jgi:putative transposase
MSAAALLRQVVQPLVPVADDPLGACTDKQRTDALRLEAHLMPAVLKVRGHGLSVKCASKWLAKTRGGEIGLSASSIERHLQRYLDHGVPALVSGNTGRRRRNGGWEALALEYFRLPSKLAASTIAEKLRDEHGFADATDGRVRRYLDSIPTNEGDFHPRRVGPHYRRQNLTPHVIRDRSVVPVGLIYQGDGHALHYYVRHPEAGHHITAELTPWMDIGSRYITGWWLGYAESAVQTLYSLSHALLSHDHVMAMLHVDPGSGFKNKMIIDAVAGFAPRIGLRPEDVMTALPGNARGKGDIEGWFRWFEEKHGKFQPSYHGPEVPQEFLRRLTKRIEQGEMYVPAWDEALAGIAKYVRAYNERNQRALTDANGRSNRSPAALWETLERHPVHIPASALMRPREIRKARSYRVQMFNRVYEAAALAAFEGRDVQVEYDLHNDTAVLLYDLKGRLIGTAEKVDAKPWIDGGRIADLERRRLDGQVRRLQQRQELLEAMARPAITGESAIKQLESFGAAELPPEEEKAEGLPPLDLLNTDY